MDNPYIDDRTTPMEQVLMWPADQRAIEARSHIKPHEGRQLSDLTYYHKPDGYRPQFKTRYVPRTKEDDDRESLYRQEWLSDDDPYPWDSSQIASNLKHLPYVFKDIHDRIPAVFGSELWVDLVNWERRYAERWSNEDKWLLSHYINWTDEFVLRNWGDLERLRNTPGAPHINFHQGEAI